MSSKKPASPRLCNTIDKKILKKAMEEDPLQRSTCSFYRYTAIQNPAKLRDELYSAFSNLKILGRIYIASEGINAQFSVPSENEAAFKAYLNTVPAFENMAIKKALSEQGYSFYKLIIKIRKKIVADGLAEAAIDLNKKGCYLSPLEFHEKAQENSALLVDARNHYETEIGHFKQAILSESSSFREQLPLLAKKLKGQEEQEILLYCTGGIRCEKASAYLAEKGFQKLYQLEGGIIEYCHAMKQNNKESLFIGKNFTFDHRLGETVSPKRIPPISKCHQCSRPCDTHRNCKNEDCHLLFIQCHNCYKRMAGCCSSACREISMLPLDEQRKLRRGRRKTEAIMIHAHQYRKGMPKSEAQFETKLEKLCK